MDESSPGHGCLQKLRGPGSILLELGGGGWGVVGSQVDCFVLGGGEGLHKRKNIQISDVQRFVPSLPERFH